MKNRESEKLINQLENQLGYYNLGSYLKECAKESFRIIGRNKFKLQCPVCSQKITVYHLDWKALNCTGCKMDIEQDDYNIKVL